MFQVCFKGVSRKIAGCLNGILYGFQRCVKKFKGLLVNFHGGFKRVFKKVSRVFHGRLHFQLELL